MHKILIPFLLLSTCHAAPAYAAVFPDTYDGKCFSIHMDTNKKHHPDNAKKETGYIPIKLDVDNSDILKCLPHKITGGPK